MTTLSYLTEQELLRIGFKSFGKNVLVSSKASIYTPHLITLGDNCRIDDFCVLSGKITLGMNSSVAVFCNLAAGRAQISIADFSTLAYGCHIISQSDDYSGQTLTNPTIPREFKNEKSVDVLIGRHVILGTSTIVLPGVIIPDGVASGANTLFTESPESWSIYVGSPARKLKNRSRELLQLEANYLNNGSD